MKKTLVESGLKRGAKSGPPVRATSAPPAICLSQIRVSPSRLEANAQRRPSGETAGAPSRPEDVTYFRRGGARGRGAERRPAIAPSTRRSAPITTSGIQREALLPAALA